METLCKESVEKRDVVVQCWLFEVLKFTEIYQYHRAHHDGHSPECTPLKSKYYLCFSAWFEGYLEPAVAVSSLEPSAYSKQKADRFESLRVCGNEIEGDYRLCIYIMQ